MKSFRLNQGIRYREFFLDLQHRLKRSQKQPQRNIFRRQMADGKLQRFPRHITFLALRHRVENRADFFEAAVFQNARHQFLSRIFFLRLLFLRRFWQHHAGLDLKECRRHDQKLAGNLDIEFLRLVQIRHILLCQTGDRDIIDIDLVFINEMHKEIHRPLKGIQFDFIFLHSSIRTKSK